MSRISKGAAARALKKRGDYHHLDFPTQRDLIVAWFTKRWEQEAGEGIKELDIKKECEVALRKLFTRLLKQARPTSKYHPARLAQSITKQCDREVRDGTG
jgi:hypothetical protein